MVNSKRRKAAKQRPLERMVNDMQYVIELPEDLKRMIIDESCFKVAHAYRLAACVRAGVTLPEHHGRLIDADAIKYASEEISGGGCEPEETFYVRKKDVDCIETLVEATSESEKSAAEIFCERGFHKDITPKEFDDRLDRMPMSEIREILWKLYLRANEG